MNNTEIKSNDYSQSESSEIEIDKTVYIVNSSNVGTTNLEYILVNWMVNKAVKG